MGGQEMAWTWGCKGRKLTYDRRGAGEQAMQTCLPGLYCAACVFVSRATALLAAWLMSGRACSRAAAAELQECQPQELACSIAGLLNLLLGPRRLQ